VAKITLITLGKLSNRVMIVFSVSFNICVLILCFL